MDVKMISHSPVCVVCLCVERSIRAITDVRILKYYMDTLREIPLNTITTPTLHVCWECEVLLKKAVQFRQQMQDSHRILQTYTKENLNEFLLTEISRPPRYNINKIDSITIEPDKDYHKNNTDLDLIKNEDVINKVDSEKKSDNTKKLLRKAKNSTTKKKKDRNKKKNDPDDYFINDVNETNMQSVFVKDEVKNEASDFEISDSCAVDSDWSDDSIDLLRMMKKIKSNDKSNNHSNKETITNGEEALYMKDEVKNEDPDFDWSDDSVGELINMTFKNKRKEAKARRKKTVQNNAEEENHDLNEITLNGDIKKNIDAQFEPENDVKESNEINNVATAFGLLRKSKPVKKRNGDIKSDNVKEKVKQSKNKYYTTIDLSHEEMLQERRDAISSDSFVNATYKCDSCIIGFQYKRPYKAHLSSRHSKSLGDCICPICKTVVSSVDSFTTHYKRHMRRFQCNFCEKRTIDRGRIKQHLYSEHHIMLSTIKCKQCGHVSQSLDSHVHHLDTHKGRFKCKECTKTFKHRGGLKNHIIAVHELKNNFPCGVCHKVFRWKNSLRRHTEVHQIKESTEAAFCEPCGIGFKSVCSYQRHMKNSLKHVTHEQRKYVCDHCNKRFIDKTKLRDHIEDKHLHRTYQCHICLK